MKSKSKDSKKHKNLDIADPLDRDFSEFLREDGWKAVQYELKEKKDKVLSIRLSEKLLSELKRQAKAMGFDTQKFVRIILESSVRKRASL